MAYRAKATQKISFEAAFLERDYFRYQEQINHLRFVISLLFLDPEADLNLRNNLHHRTGQRPIGRDLLWQNTQLNTARL
jgi:hypothetical protein